MSPWAAHDIQTHYDYWIIDKYTLLDYRYAVQQAPNIRWEQRWLSRLLLFPVVTGYQNRPYVPEAELARALFKGSPAQATDGDFILFTCHPGEVAALPWGRYPRLPKSAKRETLLANLDNAANGGNLAVRSTRFPAVYNEKYLWD